MSRFLILILLVVSVFELTGQENPSYTWLKGSNIANQFANYGVKNSPSSNNIPGARENANSWVDKNGDFWLFGGHGYAASGNQGYLNDLWKFEIKSNQWIWVSGSNTINSKGVYGVKGNELASNVPGSRQNAYSWVDKEGDLWLFGGNGYANTGGLTYLNDLWKFNTKTNNWVWISGNNTANSQGVYGVKLTMGIDNIPGARFGGNAWTDKEGNLWLFGGQENHNVVARLNDLWKYDVMNNSWVWITGSNQVDQNGVYGQIGSSSDLNTPGARQAGVSWVDTNNCFWLFGGYGYPESGTSHSYLNDLWKFDTNTNQWTWVSGSNLLNQPGNYGSKGVETSSTVPGARQMSIGWSDNQNNLWMFGCWGYNGPQFGRMNDLWKFNMSNQKWTWVSGSNKINEAGVYGELNQGSKSNLPGARRMSVSFKSTNGEFYLFGGNGYDKKDTLGLLNDFWKISYEETNSLERKDRLDENFQIFPTLFTDELFIQNNDGVEQFIFTDLIGNSFKIYVSESNKLDVSKLKPGIYFVRSNKEKIEKQIRVVKY